MDSPLINYLSQSSFHGFRYITEPNRHWTERLFWLVCCGTSWCVSMMVIASAWESFQNSAISFVVETTYTEWNTDFPAVYVCETGNEKKIARISDRLFGDPHDYNLDEIVNELAFYREHYFFTMEMCGPQVAEPQGRCVGDFSAMALEARSNCTELFRRCQWNNVEFNCCDFFVAMETDLGRCYGLNSQQTRMKNCPKLPMISNRTLGPGSLSLALNNAESRVYMMGPLEVPSVSASPTDFLQMAPRVAARRTVRIKEVENQPEVRHLTVRQRKCRYADEATTDQDAFPFYSYSACLTQCRKDAQLFRCGWAHHLMPNTPDEKRCNYSGLACFQSHFRALMVRKPRGSAKVGLECDCLPSCTEIQLDGVADRVEGFLGDYSVIELALDRLPTERYMRTVVRGPLDITVSIGSATALFLGASFLSLLETVHYFLTRPIIDRLLGANKRNNPVLIFRNANGRARMRTISRLSPEKNALNDFRIFPQRLSHIKRSGVERTDSCVIHS